MFIRASTEIMTSCNNHPTQIAGQLQMKDFWWVKGMTIHKVPIE